MKKDGFNPRMNRNELKRINVFKMSVEELEKQNEQMKIQLNRKIKIGSSSNSSRNSVGKNNSNPSSRITKGPNRSDLISLNKERDNSKSINKSNGSTSNINIDKSYPDKGNIMSGFKNKLNSQMTKLDFIPTKTEKLLIPAPEELDYQKKLNNLKLCQKVHLPKEKNYFISEQNIKLIESALNEKDSDIESLRYLLSMAKLDFDSFQLKYKELYSIIDELSNEKNALISNLEFQMAESSQLKENYDDYVFQYNKILIIFKKVQQTMSLLFKLCDSIHDYKTNCQTDDGKFKFTVDEKSRLIKIYKEIDNIINDEELRTYNYIFTRESINSHTNDDKERELIQNKNLTFLKPIEKDYMKLEKQNKELKSKLYDLENFIKKIPHLYQSKTVDLSDVAKDMIDMKKRIVDLNITNDNSEKENEYLRICYHNLYVKTSYLF